MPLLFFKYTNFIWNDVLGALINLRGRARRQAHRFRAAARHLVRDLYLDCLSGRRLDGQIPLSEVAALAARLHVVFPASDRRPDSPAARADPATVPADADPPRQHVAGPRPVHRGTDQEDGVCRSDRGGGHGDLCPAGRTRGRGVPVRALRIRRADLLRLQRLYRHGAGDGFDSRRAVAGQLSAALSGDIHRRLLATLAHHAVALAARLHLYPARRQPWTARGIRSATCW